MMRAVILTIPSATHRTTLGTAAAVVAVEAGATRLAGRNRPKKTGLPTPRASTPALAARQARSHDGSDEGVGLWIDPHTLAALQRECGAVKDTARWIWP